MFFFAEPSQGRNNMLFVAVTAAVGVGQNTAYSSGGWAIISKKSTNE